MAVNKNFVVKNGLEVNTDLLFADSVINKIGIGSTTPVTVLDVKGGIAGTDLQATGFTTLTKDLQVGASGSAFYVSNTNNLVGVGTSVPAYLMDIRSSVSTGQTALYVKGDMRVTGDINLDDLTIDDLKVTGVATFVGDGSGGLDSWIDIDYSGNTLTGGGTTVGIGSTVYFVDNAKAVFGAGEDLEISHDGSNSYIKEGGSGNLYIYSANLRIENADGSDSYIEANDGDAVSLYYAGTKRFATTHGGVVVAGGSSITGISTVLDATQANSTATGALQVSGGVGIAKNLFVGGGAEVTGITTITGTLDANGALDVDGHTELDDVNVAGASTFAGAIDANGALDVDGHTELDDVNVSGASTFAGAADFNGAVDIDGHTELDDVNVSGASTFAGAIDANATTQSSASTNGAATFAGGVGVAKNLFAGGGVSVGAAFTVGSGIGVTTILDQDDMAANSATALASQQSIKAYVDTQITAEDLDFSGDSGTGAVDLDSQTLAISGTASEIKTVASGQSLTISLPDDVIVGNGFTVTGIGSFLNDVNFRGKSGLTSAFWDKSESSLKFNDGGQAQFGDSQDLSIYHDGSHSYIVDSGTGTLRIETSELGVLSADGSTTMAQFVENAAVSLRHNNNTKFETGPAGVIVTGIATADGFSVGDNEKITCGNSEDLVIQHNTNENYIQSNSGHIYIRANVDDDEGDNIYLQPKSGENGIIVTHDGSVELYHDDQKTFETFANGIVVRSGGEGNDGEIQLYADQGDDNADLWRVKADTSGVFGIDSYATGSWVNKLQVNPAGAIVTGIATADGFRVGDSEYISVGAGGTGDMLLYHNGTDSFIDNSTGNMQITCNEFRVKSKTGGEAHIQTSDEGNVQLYYDGNLRITTTDDGADVGGTASIKIPVGTTAQRNSSPANGDIRYNTNLNSYEGYGNGAWGGLGGGTEIDNTIATTTATGISTFVKTDYRSAYFRLQITQGSAYQVGRYLLIHDGTTATLVEESAIATGSMLGSVSAAVSGSNVIIYINMGSSSSATITHIIDKITV